MELIPLPDLHSLTIPHPLSTLTQHLRVPMVTYFRNLFRRIHSNRELLLNMEAFRHLSLPT
jgi:hypothetical protein